VGTVQSRAGFRTDFPESRAMPTDSYIGTPVIVTQDHPGGARSPVPGQSERAAGLGLRS
jgi:hypothetical protein